MNKAEKVLLTLFIYNIVTCRTTEDEIHKSIQWLTAVTTAILFILWP